MNKTLEQREIDFMVKHNTIFSYLNLYNNKSTLLSYYEDGDYYSAHQDASVLTAVTHIFKEPQTFQGGDLLFPDFNGEIKVRNNHTVIFPGMINHSVTKVTMNDEDLNKKYGRFCMTQFLHFR